MRIKAVIHEQYKETEIHVCKDTADAEVRGILGELHALFDESLIGMDLRGGRHALSPAEIVTFVAEGQRVYAVCGRERFSIPQKLYELEERFAAHGFVRISKSEIINFRQMKSMDMSLAGTIKVIMKNGYETYTSRRNVAKIKELLRKEKNA